MKRIRPMRDWDARSFGDRLDSARRRLARLMPAASPSMVSATAPLLLGEVEQARRILASSGVEPPDDPMSMVDLPQALGLAVSLGNGAARQPILAFKAKRRVDEQEI